MATLDSLGADLPTDPDAQATVTDFLDYTEYLPSDLVRSLRLVGNLDESYLDSAERVQKLTKIYGSLPSLSPGKRPSSQHLRQEISLNLDQAINARESAAAEASRLFDQVDRHYNRLTSIISKLHALPKPPSRDQTPVQQARSPQLGRTRKPAIDGIQDGTPATRITLRLGDQKITSSGRITGSAPKPRYRSQKLTVPGEVLPPPNPDSPPPVTDSEWEFAPPSPVPMATSRVGVPSRSRPPQAARIRVHKSPKPPKAQSTSRPPRAPGVMGTNVHSAVAGISTSNALSLLEPPPPDAKPGSMHAPWMRLTEWEMAKLRKRMKKNAIWSPSETMIRRELADAGRGPDNYRVTKAHADAAAEPFLDDDNIATTAPGKPLGPGEISTDSLLTGDSQLSNRGMKLNEAKKQKRDMEAREQAQVARDEMLNASQNLATVGSNFKDLFTKSLESAPNSPLTAIHQPNGKAPPEKRERVRDRAAERRRREERERDKAKAKEQEIEERKERERQKELEQEREREEQRQKEQEKERKLEAERKRAAEEEERQRKEAQQKEVEKQKEEERKLQEEKDRELEKEREKEKEAAKGPAKKRKRETSSVSEGHEQRPEPMVVVQQVPTPTKASSKKRKTVETPSSSPKPTTTTTISIVPLAPPAPSPPMPTLYRVPSPPREPPNSSKPSVRSRGGSLTLRGPAPPKPSPTESAKPSSRSASRASSRRASAGPPSTPIRATREKLPRASATPAPPTPVRTAASRRSKRPAPGPVTEAQEGGPAVSVGKRKAAPKKKATATASQAAKKAAEGNAKAKEEETRLEEEAASDEIDPDEPRYCLCGDVSWGEMVGCENPDCEKEWFHYECVGLTETPGRRVKWYCPDCRPKFGKK